MADGVAFDLDEDDHPEVIGPPRLDWIRARINKVMLGSDAILAASRHELPWFEQPGLYFLIWQDRICYAGQAQRISLRLAAHIKEGRPIERVAVILGIPKWAQDEFEHAYIAAWDLPWNEECRRTGQLSMLPELLAAANALDRSAVMGWHTPTLSYGAAMKKWQLHVLGYRQAHP